MSPWRFPDEPAYCPAAMHVVADSHATEFNSTYPPAVALAGSGASLGVHEVPEPVTSRPSVLPDESTYWPTRTQVAVVHVSGRPTSDPTMTLGLDVEALAGSGISVGVQLVSEPLSSSPCWVPDVSSYVHAVTQEVADEQATAGGELLSKAMPLRGSGASVGVQALGEPVIISSSAGPLELPL